VPRKIENQTIILDQLAKYVDIMRSQRPDVYHLHDVITLKEALKDGHCSGLTALWFYYKRRNKRQYFYDHIINPILDWDGEIASLTPELKQNMEQALSWTRWTQAVLSRELLNTNLLVPSNAVTQVSDEHKKTDNNIEELKPKTYSAIQQSDYKVLLGVIKQSDYPDLRKEFEIAFLFTKEELADLIKKLPPDKDIMISDSDHVLGLFFDGVAQQYTLFDSNGFLLDVNNPSGERSFEKHFHISQIEVLIQNIQNALFHPPNSTILGINISVFDDTEKPMPFYPNRVEYLKTIVEHRENTKKKIDINTSDKAGDTVLHFAAYNGHLDTVEYLISLGANIELTNKKTRTPLDCACNMGHLSVVQTLLERAKKIYPDYKARFDGAIFCAALCDHLPIVEYLLQENMALYPGVIRVAVKSNNIALVELLLNAPGGLELINNPQKIDGINCTPLYFAAKNNNPKIIELLLQKGAHFYTLPLHIAVVHNNLAALQALLQSKEAQKWINGSDCIKLLHFAIRNDRVDCIQLLLQAGVDPKKVLENKNAMQLAVSEGRLKVMECLLKHDKTLLTSTSDEGTLLHLAIRSGNLQSVRFLLEQGIDFENTVDGTPNILHVAIEQDNKDIVALLLQYVTNSALLDTKDQDGLTPLKLSKGYGREIVTLLEQSKARMTQLQTEAHKKATEQIKKNWIDQDYPFLVQIRTLYLLEENQLRKFELELMEMSEYINGLRDPITLLGLEKRLERLEIIQKKIRINQLAIENKTGEIAISITNESRKAAVIQESERPFLDFSNDVQRMQNKLIERQHELLSDVQKPKANKKPTF